MRARESDPDVGGVLALGHGADPAGAGLHDRVLTLGALWAGLPRLTAWDCAASALAQGGAGCAWDVGEAEALRFLKVGREGGGVARWQGERGVISTEEAPSKDWSRCALVAPRERVK